ncbi:MAG: hypothetical protein KGI09_08560, partial [Thaumarchaeota archaeon]|nr:hypothetical protein [Nitrososphaerota archaeon]
MKTQPLLIILFCAVLAFCVPGASTEESITVATDKTSYGYGDNYTVSGTVSPVVPQDIVSILILGTIYHHPEALSVTPDPDGRYSYTLPLPIKDVPAGNFTIIAQYAGVKNQTTFSYAGLPCSQQNISAYGIAAPIIRGPASNPRILDSLGNAITGPVKIGQQIQITYPLANGLNCNQPFVYIVQIQDHNGITISLSWITGTLLAGQSFDPAQSWMPQYNDTYTAQIFVWQSLVNPNALAPPASISFDVQSNANLTKSSHLVSEIPKSTDKFPTTVPNSPLKQFKSGTAVNDVVCRADLKLVVRSEDGYPACVTPDTAQKLIKRGWAKDTNSSNLAEGSTSLPITTWGSQETFDHAKSLPDMSWISLPTKVPPNLTLAPIRVKTDSAVTI